MPGSSASNTRNMIWLTLEGFVMKGDDHIILQFPSFVAAVRQQWRTS
jgi:hypothetical protein